MYRRTRVILGGSFAIVVALVSLVTALAAGPSHASATESAGPLTAAFAAAAQQEGVPESLLLAISYAETQWNANLASTSSGTDANDNPTAGESVYGPMALYDDQGRGTLDQAAADLGVSASQVRSDPATNIMGAAAVLVDDARATNNGKTPSSSDVNQWYGAVARYAGTSSYEPSKWFTDHVYGLIAQGVQGTASDGEALSVPAESVNPDTSQLDVLNLSHLQPGPSDYPNTDAWIPAGGNHYGAANRPNKDLFIQYIVIHDTEVDYPGTVRAFQDPGGCCSSNYVVDGAAQDQGVYPTVTQFVHNKDIAYHAGNYWFNQHSIGIEHVGFADNPSGSYYTQRMYDLSANLVAYLCAVYDIPIDRNHILGHASVPGPTPIYTHGMHWDPGPFWDWDYYLGQVKHFYAQWTSNPLPAASVPAPFTATRSVIRTVSLASGQTLSGWVSGGSVNFTPVYADDGGAPSSQLVLGASDPSTWTNPSSYDNRDFSCDNLPDATQSANSTWQEDTNSDLRAKAERGEAYALLDQVTITTGSGSQAVQTVWDKIDFNGVTGWVRDADTSAGWGVIVTFTGSGDGTLYGRPALSATYAICSTSGSDYSLSRVGQSYVSQDAYTDPATGITWYEIYYNHRDAWVPASEVTVS